MESVKQKSKVRVVL